MAGSQEVALSGDDTIDALLVVEEDEGLSAWRWDTTDLTFSFPSSGWYYVEDQFFDIANAAQLAGFAFATAPPPLGLGLGPIGALALFLDDIIISTVALNGFQEFNEAQKDAARFAMDQFDGVSGLTLSESDEGLFDHEDLRFAETATTQAPAFGIPPLGRVELLLGEGVLGDTWYINDGTFDSPVPGSFADWTIMHEAGHALGLKHSHEEGLFGGRIPDWLESALTDVSGPILDVSLDTLEFTVMTYTGNPGEFDHPQTLMMLDIQAIQYLYGADFGHNAGNTTYRWDPATGVMSINGAAQRTPGANRVFMTIWDGDGNDTYDLSNYATDVSINLLPGEWTLTAANQLAVIDGSQVRGNVANARLFNGDTRSLIENGTGGAGNDTLTGNEAANLLVGNAGDDSILGALGEDTLEGGAGDDTLNGGADADTLLGGLGEDSILGGDGGDCIEGGDGGDTIAGGAEADTIAAGGGDDSVDGGDGADTITGGVGNDTLLGADGADSLTGEAGADRIEGGAQSDAIDGGDGADTLLGQAGADTILGGANDDRIEGGDSGDHLRGDGGNDTILGQAGEDDIAAGAGNDWLEGGIGDDTIDGGSGNNTIGGGNGLDWISAGSGNDRIEGGDGDDTVDGGTGDNTIGGGNGADWIATAGGDDWINGGDGGDVILSGDGSDTVAGGLGGDVILTQAGSDSVDGGDGSDTILAGDGEDTVAGGVGDDSVMAGAGNDDVLGGAGQDTLRGDAGLDTIAGGTGADLIHGGDDADLLTGGLDDDDLFGEGGGDTLFGNAGDDTLAGGAGMDTLDGGDGIDMASYSDATGPVTINLQDPSQTTGDAAGDVLISIEQFGLSDFGDTFIGLDDPLNGDVVFGRGGDDTLLGFAGDDTLHGEEGDDYIVGGEGADEINGGDGFDTTSFEQSKIGIVVDLVDPSRSSGIAEGDTITDVEGFRMTEQNDEFVGLAESELIQAFDGNDTIHGNGGDDTVYGGTQHDELHGGSGHDSLVGETGNDLLRGEGGDDFLLGGADHDTLDGGNGADTLKGGSGGDSIAGGLGDDELWGGSDLHRDVFVFNAPGWGIDEIMDFNDRRDVIQMTGFEEPFGRPAFNDNLQISDQAGYALVELSAGGPDQIWIWGAAAADLNHQDFQFV